MVSAGAGTAGAGAEVPIGTVAMMTARMGVEVTAEGMMTVITMKVGAGGAGVQVQEVGGVEAEVQVAGGIAVLLGKEVKRGVLKLNSGIGKRKKHSMLSRLILVARIIELKMTTMMWTTKGTRNTHSGMDMGIDDIRTGLFFLPSHLYSELS